MKVKLSVGIFLLWLSTVYCQYPKDHNHEQTSDNDLELANRPGCAPNGDCGPLTDGRSTWNVNDHDSNSNHEPQPSLQPYESSEWLATTNESTTVVPDTHQENDTTSHSSTTLPPQIDQTTEVTESYNNHTESSNQLIHFSETNGTEPSIPELQAPAVSVRPTITIAVLGRSGSGVSSTIHELIGPNRIFTLPKEKESLKNILEYTISPLDSAENQYEIKLLDVPGFSLEKDAQILASLKSYIQSNGFPTFYLAVSRFDDNRFDGEDSLFVRFLKRVQLFRKVLNVTEDNTAFLFTHFMTATKALQRTHQSKLNLFQGVIQRYTDTFPSLHLVVGDNKAVSEHEMPVEQGYAKLPNKELYPKNIWETLQTMASNVSIEGDELSAYQILTSILGSREEEMRCSARLVPTHWNFYDGDAEAFAYLLEHNNIVVPSSSEVNLEIESAFRNTSDDNMKLQGGLQKLVLQLRLERQNITRKDDLPVSGTDRARFFQKTQITPGIEVILLKLAFDLKMPEYIKPMTVSFGYDLVEDEKSNVSPFKSNTSVPSSVGYELPEFMTCRKYSQPEVAFVKGYSKTYEEYVSERLEFLDFLGRDTMNLAAFKGRLKEGFNMEPEESENVVTLSSVKEVRTVECFLNRVNFTRDQLNDDFLKAVDEIAAFDEGSRDSVNWWNNFFSTYGSHVVTKGYGGGNIYGSLVGEKVRRLLDSRLKIEGALNSILDFTPFSEPSLESPTYRLFGGEIDAETSRMYDLNKTTRSELLSRWEDSLSTDFEMLSTSFELQPMSTFVKEIDVEKGRHLAAAIGLRLSGDLVFKRRSGRPSSGGASNRTGQNRKRLTTVQPELFSTTPSRTMWTTRQPSPGQSQFPLFSGPSQYEETEGDVSQFLIAEMNNANATVTMLEETVAETRRLAEEKHREDQERFSKHREEQNRLAEERDKRLTQTVRENDENTRNFYSSRLNQINEEDRLEKEAWEKRMGDLRTHEEEEEERHRQLLADIERQTREEEERRRKEEKDSCWFYCT